MKYIERAGKIGVMLDVGFGGAGEVTSFTSIDEVVGNPLIAAAAKGALCDMLRYAGEVLCLRPAGGGYASCAFGRAKYEGTAGNRITLGVYEEESGYRVVTYIDGISVSSQTIAGAEELMDSEYVVFDTSVSLFPTAGVPMTGGADAEEISDGTEYAVLLSAFDEYEPDMLLTVENDDDFKSAAIEYVRGRRKSGFSMRAVMLDCATGEDFCFSFSSECGADALYTVAGMLCAMPFYSSVLSLSVGEDAGANEVSPERAKALAGLGQLSLIRYGQEECLRFAYDVSSDGNDGSVIRTKDEIRKRAFEMFCDKFYMRTPTDGSGSDYFDAAVGGIITELGEKYGVLCPASVKTGVLCGDDGGVTLSVDFSPCERAAGFDTRVRTETEASL
ncbi:MAG: hypothetical protein LUH54_02210 [Firmicutes bacterium]|nr:hypothetical protein [Bacillota bacterium]